MGQNDNKGRRDPVSPIFHNGLNRKHPLEIEVTPNIEITQSSIYRTKEIFTYSFQVLLQAITVNEELNANMYHPVSFMSSFIQGELPRMFPAVFYHSEGHQI